MLLARVKSPVVNRLQLLKVLKAAMVLYMLTWFEAHACIAERVSASCLQDCTLSCCCHLSCRIAKRLIHDTFD